MGQIELPNMRFYTYNGVHEEEKKLGQQLRVDVRVYYPIEMLVMNDDLTTTISYSDIYRTVAKVVTQNQFNLIESVALLLMKTLMLEFPQATQVDVSVTKHAIPIPGVYDPFTISVSSAEA